ncbi:MAG: Vitamin B12 transporter BtuB [Ignavibacteria bacterium]|nr:Vitamin B12 transporter BtuB [Ignavibacteria bacterium]
MRDTKRTIRNSFHLIAVFLIIICASDTYAQKIKGTVYGKAGNKKEILDGAIVKWINTKSGTVTDENGSFELSTDGISDKRFIVSYIGYKADTIDAENNLNPEIVLISNSTTDEIIVEDKRASTYIGDELIKTEVITAQELVKDACCDLSGCFGRNSSVEVAVTDILTDSKELKILGLEGVYTQILIDNMPLMTGLNVKYGVSSFPGTIIDKITVSKGSNSVLQGYESISGIMNVLLKNYNNSDKLLVNAFVNSMLEKQMNLNYSRKLNTNLNTILSFHTVQKSNPIDHNHDGFLDNPLITRYTFYNKWDYKNIADKSEFNLAARYWYEERTGGKETYSNLNHTSENRNKILQDNRSNEITGIPEISAGEEHDSSAIYKQTVDINSVEGYMRFSKTYSKNSGFKLYLNSSYYDQYSLYGITDYYGKQISLAASGFYEYNLSKSSYIKAGLSYKYLDIDEEIKFSWYTSKNYDGSYPKLESIPGIFTEFTSGILNEKGNIMLGIRYDYHNKYKSIITPRVLLRFKPNDKFVMRASFGTGFRTINLFNEYSNILASSRYLIVSEELNPEKIINYGGDLIYYFNLGPSGGSLNLDFYRTDFVNKIIPDYDASPSVVIFSNLNGSAYSNVFQSELNLNFFKTIDLKLAYKFIEMKYEVNGVMYDQPFNSKNRILSTFSYTLPDNSWSFNAGLQWFGVQRLPTTASNPVQYQRPTESDPYTLMNAQINRNFKYFELYAGVDNILNFTQPEPIIAADDPFGPYFDTSFIWGPVKGREFYFGFRYKMD